MIIKLMRPTKQKNIGIIAQGTLPAASAAVRAVAIDIVTKVVIEIAIKVMIEVVAGVIEAPGRLATEAATEAVTEAVTEAAKDGASILALLCLKMFIISSSSIIRAIIGQGIWMKFLMLLTILLWPSSWKRPKESGRASISSDRTSERNAKRIGPHGVASSTIDSLKRV